MSNDPQHPAKALMSGFAGCLGVGLAIILAIALLLVVVAIFAPHR